MKTFFNEKIERCLEKDACFEETKTEGTAKFRAYNQIYIERASALCASKIAKPIGDGGKDERHVFENYEFKFTESKHSANKFVWRHEADPFSIEVATSTDTDSLKTWLKSLDKNPKLIINRGVKTLIKNEPLHVTDRQIEKGEYYNQINFVIGGDEDDEIITATYSLKKSYMITFPAICKNFIKSVAICEATPELRHEHVILNELAHVLAAKLPQQKRLLKEYVMAYKDFLADDGEVFSPNYLALQANEWRDALIALEELQKSGKKDYNNVFNKTGVLVYSGYSGLNSEYRIEKVNIADKIDEMTNYIADEFLAEAITHYIFVNLGYGVDLDQKYPENIPGLSKICSELFEESMLFDKYKMPFPVGGPYSHKRTI